MSRGLMSRVLMSTFSELQKKVKIKNNTSFVQKIDGLLDLHYFKIHMK